MSLAFEGETECVLHSSQAISYMQCMVESEGRFIRVYPEWSGSFSRFHQIVGSTPQIKHRIKTQGSANFV